METVLVSQNFWGKVLLTIKSERPFHWMTSRELCTSSTCVKKNGFFLISGKGDLFGEDISRKTPAKRANGDVRALTYCDVYYITRERLQNVLHFYQDFAFKFSENLELTYDLGASEVMYNKPQFLYFTLFPSTDLNSGSRKFKSRSDRFAGRP